MLATYRTYGIHPYMYLFGGFVFFFATLGLIAYLVVAPGSSEAPPLWFSMLWLVGAGWIVYDVLVRLCYEIRLSDEGPCAPRPLRPETPQVQRITSVRPTRWGANLYTVARYRGGNVNPAAR